MPVTTYDLFGQPANPASLAVDSTNYTLGIQWSVTLTGLQTAVLAGIRFFSAAGAAVLPTQIALFAVSGRTLIHNEAASWSGAVASGWVTALFASPPALTSGTSYKATVTATAPVPPGNWYSATANYWIAGGPGANGITSGPLSAPNSANSDGGQDSFVASAAVSYPTLSGGANYWIDTVVQVTTPAVAGQPQGGGRSMLRKRLMYADV